ncbi:MAG: glycogen/starch synthase [Prevotellaceae bacterium]|jgi:starch synthase|nr:glycogen/starch synthase [Prevotellaceae bacterium]
MATKQFKRVLYISQEIFPYLPESNLALISRRIPEDIQPAGWETRTFMPKFGAINERRNQLHEVIRLSGMNLIIDDTDHPLIIKVASIQSARMQIYFIDNDDYFARKGIGADENGEEYLDNDERSIFFVRGVMETIKKLRWTPDVIHCHGWISALSPLYIKKVYCDDPFFKNTKVVYSLLNDDFQRPFRKSFGKKLKMEGITDKDIAKIKDKEVTYETLSEIAMDYSDAVVQLSENVNPAVLEYAKKSGKHVLPYYPHDQLATQFAKFYDSLM